MLYHSLGNSLFLASSFSFTHIIEALAELQKKKQALKESKQECAKLQKKNEELHEALKESKQECAELQKENEELHARLQVRDDLQERRHRSSTDPTHFYDTKSISSRSEFEMSAFPPPVDELNSKPRPAK